MLIGRRSPSRLTIKMDWFTIGTPVSMVLLKEQSFSQMLALKTSQQWRPSASSFLMPVMFSAALLKDVMMKSPSTVNTPSAMLSSMIWVWFLRGCFILAPFSGP